MLGFVWGKVPQEISTEKMNNVIGELKHAPIAPETVARAKATLASELADYDATVGKRVAVIQHRGVAVAIPVQEETQLRAAALVKGMHDLSMRSPLHLAVAQTADGGTLLTASAHGALLWSTAAWYRRRALGYAAAVAIVHEELSASDPAFCLSYLAHALLFVNNLNVNGSDAQRAAFLPRACAGELLCGMAMSEPGAGTDVLGMTTRATREPSGDYVLTGTKMWITNGAADDATLGDAFLVYARDAPPSRAWTRKRGRACTCAHIPPLTVSRARPHTAPRSGRRGVGRGRGRKLRSAGEGGGGGGAASGAAPPAR
jgi:alkylation response protein AidB-like acyl-CoA dehydrogenase